MQIIIPMSGKGKRFQNAGYKKPKPLIIAEQKEIILSVIDMFPGENEFIFICNDDHLKDISLDLEQIIINYKPKAKIVGIPSHKKGPGHAVLKIKDMIKKKSPVIINYCDFTCYWNWQDFKKFTTKFNFDGVIPSYNGFHPHSFGKTNYAYLKEKNDLVIDIKEKEPFTKNKHKELASTGTYYFKNGQLLIESLEYIIDKNLSLNGEFYISLAYKYLIKKNLVVTSYKVQHFMQWGTPEDLEEYKYYSEIFKNYSKKISIKKIEGSILMPMAGLGSRFKKSEFKKQDKPFINLYGKEMFCRAIQDLPKTDNIFLIVNSKNKNNLNKSKLSLISNKNNFKKFLDTKTNGQATTAFLGIKEMVSKNLQTPVVISACDNGIQYDYNKYVELINDKNIDIIVWVARNYPKAVYNPEMYGWVATDENNFVNKVICKKILKNPKTDYVIIGTFTFKNYNHYINSYNKQINEKDTVNDEFYIDTLINHAVNLGYSVKAFEVDKYVCWGTPYELKTFLYWQECFHKWKYHKYDINYDYNFGREDKKVFLKNLDCNFLPHNTFKT